MNPILRATSRAPRASLFTRNAYISTQPRRYAHQSYGNDQSGMEKSDEASQKAREMEHPGPESPASKGSTASSSSSSQSQPSSSSGSSTDSKPAIHHPKSAAEKEDPEVREHNEDMRKRHDASANQLAEKDNKVDKGFWKGRQMATGMYRMLTGQVMLAPRRSNIKMFYCARKYSSLADIINHDICSHFWRANSHRFPPI